MHRKEKKIIEGRSKNNENESASGFFDQWIENARERTCWDSQIASLSILVNI